MLIRVSLSLNIYESLTYRYTGDPDKLSIGQRVIVPLMNRLTSGWVMEKDVQYSGRVKSVVGVIRDGYVSSSPYLDFASAVSNLYFTSAGIILDSSLSPKRKTLTGLHVMVGDEERKFKGLSLKELTPHIKKGPLDFYFKSRGKREDTIDDGAKGIVESSRGDRNVPDHRYLLGTSRIEFYEPVIRETLNEGRSVAIAVPDNLTAMYLFEQLTERGFQADLYNSDVKPTEREKLWQSYACDGHSGIVIGGMSAMMLPIIDLGLIITERAGSPLYKRTAYSKFNVNKLAQLRAKSQGVPLMEGFSTYTVQAFQEDSPIVVDDRRGNPGSGEVSSTNVHPIPGHTQGIPDAVVELAKHTYSQDKKLLVIVNRKESTGFLYCAKCREIAKCPSCGSFPSIGKQFQLTCPRCGLVKEDYQVCPTCLGNLTLVENISIASIKKVFQGKILETGIVTLTAADFKDKSETVKKAKEAPIVIATPVVVNPYFNKVFDTVIYLRPESQFDLDAYDAAEHVFAMAAEMRELLTPGGTLEIFSTFHFHYAMKLVNEEESFFERELKYRKWFHLPPFFNLYHIEVKSKKLRDLASVMRGIYSKYKDIFQIKKIYLQSRKFQRGNFKGIIEVHAEPHCIKDSGILENRDVSVGLELV